MTIDAREQPPAGHIVLTYEDYCALPDDGRRYEIIEGELYVAPSPGRAHQQFAANLLIVLKPFVAARGLGEVFIAPFDVILEETSVVVPDLLFVARERSGVVTDRGDPVSGYGSPRPGREGETLRPARSTSLLAG